MKPAVQAVFLDRDGTVIHDRGYLDCPDGVELTPRAGEALAALARAGLKLVLITNQSGIGRGYFDQTAVARQHARLALLLRPFNVGFDDIRICPHTPGQGCACRKPAPGMLMAAARKLNIALPRSFMVGDKPSDIEAGRRAGCRDVIAVGAVDGADYQAVDMMDAANYILARLK